MFFLFQVKIWFQNRRSKYKKMMKAGPGSVPPPNMLTSGGMPGSPSHGGGSPMMHPQSHTPNSSQGQMSPVGPGQGHVSLGHHSPGIGGNPHHQHQHQHHSHLQQQHHRRSYRQRRQNIINNKDALNKIAKTLNDSTLLTATMLQLYSLL